MTTKAVPTATADKDQLIQMRYARIANERWPMIFLKSSKAVTECTMIEEDWQFTQVKSCELLVVSHSGL